MMAKQTKLLYLIGFWAAIVAFVGAVGYIVSAFLQVFNVVGPLQDSFIGYGTSLLIPVPFLLTMLVLHYIIPAEKKFWTHTAIAFAIIYTTYNTLLVRVCSPILTVQSQNGNCRYPMSVGGVIGL